jgi:hypothetical protein
MKVLKIVNDPEVKNAMSLCFGLYSPGATVISSVQAPPTH